MRLAFAQKVKIRAVQNVNQVAHAMVPIIVQTSAVPSIWLIRRKGKIRGKIIPCQPWSDVA
jgi:hypothetical protein